MPEPLEIPQSAAVCMVSGRMILVSNKKRSRWVLPKGHLEPGDPDFASRAAREAWEEAGVRGELGPEAIGSYPYRKRGRDYRVRVFLIERCSLADNWPEQSKRERILVPPKQAARMVREPELQRILNDL